MKTKNASLERDDEGDDQPNTSEANARGVWDYAKEFRIFLPYLWPDENLLRCKVILLVFYPFMLNILNFLVPRQLGIVYDSLKSGDGIYFEIFILGVLWLLNSGAGIQWLKYYLWKPVQIHGYKAINSAAHSHVMKLSSDFHENKEPQTIFNDINQGQSVTNLMDKVCFNLIPMLIDLVIIYGYLYQLFGAYMALIVAFTTFFYIYTTTRLLKRNAPTIKDYQRYYRTEWRSGTSTIECWPLASYYNNIEHEHDRYVSNMQVAGKYRKDYVFGITLTSACQSSIMKVGQIAGCFLAIYQVRHKLSTYGDLTVLLSYWAQLEGQLSFFSNAYTSIFEEMMKARRLIEILKTAPSIVDNGSPKSLQVKAGEIKFENVHFRYTGMKDTLKGVSFIAPGSKVVGIVGGSGSGKSTLVKLLTRFYDLREGSVEIDGQDVRNVNLESLRKEIAVVSQDPTMFNDTIMNNILYAKWGASREEVYTACRSAAIHDSIMLFSDGYDTRVGNRIKLSGGEKQRIAIARGILKGCKIIVLDEATSSVDTKTEQLIQEGLGAVFLGCTVLVIAHRLSTIRDADLIVVIENGGVVEQGTHDNLLAVKGKYHELWDAQTRKND